VRACWVDSGNDPAWQQLAKHGMTALFYPLSDPPADVRRRLEEAKARGYAGGVYAAWNWPGMDEKDGAAFAQWVHAGLKNLVTEGLVVTPSRPKVQLNNERHEPEVILAMLRRWRALRPNTNTSWTFEGGQGGWMTPAFVAEVISLKVRLVPQLYNGPMTEVWDSLAYARDLTKRGFPDALISSFYDAGRLPEPVGWDGWAFTQGRLP
jgi:hypothetical protein